MKSTKKLLIVALIALFATTSIFAKDSQRSDKGITFDLTRVIDYTPDFKLTSSGAVADSIADSIFQMILELFVEMWQKLLMETRFNSYPYKDGNRYIGFSSADEGLSRYSRWSIGTEVGSIPNFSYVNTSTFEGMLVCIGPFVQNTILSDGSTMTGCVDLGGQFSLVHLSPFSLYFHAAVNLPYTMGGSSQKLSESVGTTIGAQVYSYFKQPFVLSGRFNYTAYEESDYFFGDASLGYMMGRLEVYGGYKYIGRLDKTVAMEYQKVENYHGFKAGAKLYF